MTKDLQQGLAPVRLPISLSAIGAAAMVLAAPVYAFDLDTGNEDLQVRWDNTLKYSVGERLNGRLPALSNNRPVTVNQDDGDNNFGKGLIQNRIDLLSEFDAKYRNVGVRVSGAAWYDPLYLRSNDNTTTTANRPAGQPSNAFPGKTQTLMGRDVELLDAFVFGQFDIDDRPLTVRAGRHTLLWGESLFFAANSIAGGQAPVDVIKALQVPNSTTKEIVRPTGKVSMQMQVADDFSVAAYVPYEWEKSRLMPVGSYLSTSDSVGPGAELNFTPFGAAPISEKNAKNSGQGGLSLRWHVEPLNTDFGFHVIRFNQTTPSNVYVNFIGVPGFGGVPQNLQWQYHEGTRAYGISATKTVGEWNIGGEVSMRDNQPLASNPATTITLPNGTVLVGGFDNNHNPGYAVGRTLHANLNWIASLGPSWLYREATFTGEIAWNRRMSITAGEGFANPLANRDAAAIRVLFTPTYRQVLDGLDVSFPIGTSYTAGRSSALGAAFGPNKGGDINIGVQGTYLQRWNIGLSYVHYYGPAGTTLDANQQVQFKQALKDRDFISLSVSTTF